MPVLSAADIDFWEENGYVVVHDAGAPGKTARQPSVPSGISLKWIQMTQRLGIQTRPDAALWSRFISIKRCGTIGNIPESTKPFLRFGARRNYGSALIAAA